MLLPSCMWLSLLASPAPGAGPSASAPAEPGTEVAVLPLAVQGELPARWYDEAGAKLVSGLSRGTLRVVSADVPATCRTPVCWSEHGALSAADFMVSASLTVGDTRDYAITIDVTSARTGKVVASAEGTCELCGFEEAISMIETRAAVLAPEIARLGAVLPVLLFRSEPVGVMVALDGEVFGPTPLRVQAPAGPHTVEATLPGFLPQSFEIEAVDGVRKEVALRLVPVPDDPLPRGRGLVIAGASTGAGGLLALGAGVTLLILDGRPFRRRCEADANGTCQFQYETTVGGAVGATVGGVAVLGGIGMLAAGLVRAKRSRRSDAQARVMPSVGGLRVRF